jgi:hypothetical protein
MPTTEDIRLEIHSRYWRDWAGGGWGYWHPCRPNIKYNSQEEHRPYVLKVMQDRIAKIKSRRPENDDKVQYKIVKVIEIRIVEDVL